MHQNVVVTHEFEVRGSDVYPTRYNDQYGYTSDPVFEIRGSDFYPTRYNNEFYSTSYAVFEILGDTVYPTSDNDQYDDTSEPVFEIRGTQIYKYGEAGPEIPAGVLALGLAGLFVASKAKSYVSRRREEAAEREAAIRQTLTAAATSSAPAGWYPLDGELRFWNGVAWTEHTAPARFSGYEPGFQAPTAVLAPKNGSGVAIAWILTALTFGYMLPWAVAVTRGVSNSTKVGLVSLFLGWTIVGWIAALVMALTGDQVAYVPRRA